MCAVASVVLPTVFTDYAVRSDDQSEDQQRTCYFMTKVKQEFGDLCHSRLVAHTRLLAIFKVPNHLLA